MPESSYYFAAGNDAAAERQRLGLLEAVYNPPSIARLERLGVAPGWRCLELGAGGGSMTRWLAGRVGDAGRVVAIDRDTRFLGDLGAANVEVRDADVLAAPIEAGAFDLAYTRFTLMHLNDAAKGLAALTAALKPGGRLLAEEGDYGAMAAAAPGHPAAALFDDVQRRLRDYFATPRWSDAYFGRRLPALFKGLGLADIGEERSNPVRRGGGPAGLFHARSFALKTPRLVDDGVIAAAEAGRVVAAFADPGFRFVDMTVVALWGRKG